MDLLDQESADDFTAALRDVTDTFFRTLVVLRLAAGGDVELLAGVTPAGDGQGQAHGELVERERGEEIAERYAVKFNRAYLAEKGLVDGDGTLLVTVDDLLLIYGRRFTLSAVADRALFRGVPLLVVLEAVR